MKLTWPAGTVPHRRDPQVPDELWDLVRRAIAMWDGVSVWNSELAFVSAASVRPILHFDTDAGCGVIRRSTDTLTFALSSCSDATHIAREIGVALGLPRMHQRNDRDRYLDLADPGEFDCRKGQFFERCPREAEIGAFTTESVMFAPAPSEIPPHGCALEPLGSYLYLPKDFEGEPSESSCGRLLDGNEQPPFSFDRAMLAELYAASRGWVPFRPVGWVPQTPWNAGLEMPFEPHSRAPVITTEDELRVYTREGGRNRFWRAAHSSGGWTGWRRGPENSGSLAFDWTLLPVSGSTLVDTFMLSEAGIMYGRFSDDAQLEGTVLGQQPPYLGTLDVVRIDDETIALFVFDFFGVVHVAETVGQTLGDWQTVPSGLSLRSGGDVTGQGSEHHVVAPVFGGGVGYTTRTELGWSEWITLVPSLGEITSVAIALTPGRGVDVVAMPQLESTLWHFSCASECSSPSSWTMPVLIGATPTPNGTPGTVALAATDGRLDLVALFPGSLAHGGFWHKHWQPLDTPSE
jgi:hypothetical protein